MGHVTITTPLLWTVSRRWAGTSCDQTAYQIWNLFSFTHYENMKGDKNTEIGVVWVLGVTQGHQQHSHSIEHIW